MKTISFILVILFLLSSQFACTEGSNVRGIAVSQEIIDGAYEVGIDYCDLYKDALDGDVASIRKYATIDKFQSGCIYVHGVYLIRLIDRIGDDAFLKAIEGISDDEKIWIESYIQGGMDIYDWYNSGNGALDYLSEKDYWNKHPELTQIIRGTDSVLISK